MNERCAGPENTEGLSRRQCLSRFGLGLGSLAVADLLRAEHRLEGVLRAARAKRIICLFQSGAPSQLDLFDYKPELRRRNGQNLPESVRRGQRLTSMSSKQAKLPLAGSKFRFERHGESGAWVSELMPHTSKIVDDLCFVKSLHTDAINHDPAITFLQTGSSLSGRPSLGSWLSYGLGTENRDLPSYVVLITKNQGGQPVYDRLWGSGFLPSSHQGMRFRSGKDPVLFLSNPSGVSAASRRRLLARLRNLHASSLATDGDADIEARIQQYELAFRMQTSVPEVTDLKGESDATYNAYGPDSRKPGTYAANCLLARRLAERGVRCVQLFHRGWDHHGNLPRSIPRLCQQTDQASAALVQDLKQRGLLDETLVIWGGEFGRTAYSQGTLSSNNYGRDHHPRCFTAWMAGGGVRAGTTYGDTDAFGYNIQSNGVHLHDWHATILHLFGIDHERLTYKYQGRRFRLTDVHGKVVGGLLDGAV